MCYSSQQTIYRYNAYKKHNDESIVKLVVNSCCIRDISRILTVSKTTVISRILKIAKNTNDLMDVVNKGLLKIMECEDVLRRRSN